MGYKQTFTATKTSDFDDGNGYFGTYVLSMRFARANNSNSDIQIESITYSDTIDKDIVSYNNSGKNKEAIIDIGKHISK